MCLIKHKVGQILDETGVGPHLLEFTILLGQELGIDDNNTIG